MHLFPSLCFADGAELPRGSLGEAEQGEGPCGLVQSHVVVAGATQGARHQQGGRQGPRREEGQRTQQPGLAGEGNSAQRCGLQKAEGRLAESDTLEFSLAVKKERKKFTSLSQL